MEEFNVGVFTQNKFQNFENLKFFKKQQLFNFTPAVTIIKNICEIINHFIFVCGFFKRLVTN